MKVLVTGSAGFVGSNLVDALRSRGDSVLLADRQTGQDLTKPDNDYMSLALLRAGYPDVVIHLASTCSTPGSVKQPMRTFEDTVVTAARVLDAARIHQTPVILTSSVKARDGMTPYGAAKRMVELWAKEYEAAYDLPLVINRPGTIYGPGQEGSLESGWIAWFCKRRDEGMPVVLNNGGYQVRDLLHVNDYVRLLIMQANNIARYCGPIWDVGGGPENIVTVREMADYLGLDHTDGPPRHGDADIYVGINSVPGWEPQISWRDVL